MLLAGVAATAVRLHCGRQGGGGASDQARVVEVEHSVREGSGSVGGGRAVCVVGVVGVGRDGPQEGMRAVM